MARKILLADDSVTAQNMGRRILTDAGYEVVTVNNGSSALKKISESRPDLIVLDVYMPGYGGLEVCQRIREAPETARIPVLLTVGKLEPFRPDDARRVRADAYLVKPFEASELLTALTKLEDKIVPQAKSYQPGRFAKAIAAVEGAGSADFGDAQTGWKNRLKIPPPQSKSRESENQEQATEAASAAVGHRPEASPGIEQALLSALPADVTSEELAAIRAAAAAFSNQREESDRATSSEAGESSRLPEPAVVEHTVVPEPSEIRQELTFASLPEVAASRDDESMPIAPAPRAEAAQGVEEIRPEAASLPEVVPMAAAAFEEARQAEQPVRQHDDEVAAAVASLAPTNGHAASEADTWTASSGDAGPATMAAAHALGETFSGPRWIAQEVTLSEEESAFNLELEMQKAYAAFAAAAAGREQPSPVADAAVAVAAEVAAVELSPSTAEVAVTPSCATLEALPAISNEPTAAAAPEEYAVVSAESSEVQTTEVNLESAAAEVRAEVACAAAASAGASQPMASDAFTTQASAEGMETPAREEGPAESQLAAAWAHWKQIRESVVGPQIATEAVERPAEPGVSRGEESQAPQAAEPAEVAAGSTDEATAIASIVDNVLAELKPRLMEEIARKMGKQQK